MQLQVGASGPSGATVSQARNVVVDKEWGIVSVRLTSTAAKATVPLLTTAAAIPHALVSIVSSLPHILPFFSKSRMTYCIPSECMLIMYVE